MPDRKRIPVLKREPAANADQSDREYAVFGRRPIGGQGPPDAVEFTARSIHGAGVTAMSE